MAYRLKPPYWMKQLHLVFNVVKLTPAPDDPIPGRKLTVKGAKGTICYEH